MVRADFSFAAPVGQLKTTSVRSEHVWSKNPRPRTRRRQLSSGTMLIHTNETSCFDSAVDGELKRRIFAYLHQRLSNLGTLEVETHQGTAVLRGTVPSRTVRWRCVDCCRHVLGDLNVIDRLKVVSRSGTEAQTQNRARSYDESGFQSAAESTVSL